MQVVLCYQSVAHSCVFLHAGGIVLSECCSFLCVPSCRWYCAIRVLLILVCSFMQVVLYYPSVAHSCVFLHAGGIVVSECCSFLCVPSCRWYCAIRVLFILVCSFMQVVLCYLSVAHSCVFLHAGGIMLSECCSFLCVPSCRWYYAIRVLLILVCSFMQVVLCYLSVAHSVCSFMQVVLYYQSVAHSCVFLHAGGIVLSECCSFLCVPSCRWYCAIRVLLILVCSFMQVVLCHPSVAHFCVFLHAGGIVLSECCSFLCVPSCRWYCAIRVLLILVCSFMQVVLCYQSVAHSCVFLHAGGIVLSECCSFLCVPSCRWYCGIRVLLILVCSFMQVVLYYQSVAHSCVFLHAGDVVLSECCSFLCVPSCRWYCAIRVLLILVCSFMQVVLCYPSVAHSCVFLHAGGIVLSECCSFLCVPSCRWYCTIRVLLILVCSFMQVVLWYQSVAHSCVFLHAGGIVLSECCSFLCVPSCRWYYAIRVLLILVCSFMQVVLWYPSVAHSCVFLHAGGIVVSECCSFLCVPSCILVCSFVVLCYQSVVHSCVFLHAGGIVLSECCSFLCVPSCRWYCAIRVLLILVCSFMQVVLCYPSVAHSCVFLHAGGIMLSECCSFLCVPSCRWYCAIRVLLILVCSFMQVELCYLSVAHSLCSFMQVVLCSPSVAHSCAFNFMLNISTSTFSWKIYSETSLSLKNCTSLLLQEYLHNGV